MEKCALDWRRLYVAPAQCKQGPCLSWSSLNYLSVVTEQFVDIFNALPYLEGKSLQAFLVARIHLSDLVNVEPIKKEPKKKSGRRRLNAEYIKDTRPAIEIVRSCTEKQKSMRVASCVWSPLMEPILCATSDHGSVGIFVLDTSSSLIRANVVRKKLIVGDGHRVCVNFLANGDLVIGGTTVTRLASPSFESAGDPRTGAQVGALVTAMDCGHYGYSDGSVWDNEKQLWEPRNAPVSCIGVSSSVVVVAWGDLLGCVDLKNDNVKRQMDLRHGSLINSISVYGSQFCATTSNGNVTMWHVAREMPKRFKAGPEQETQLQHGLTFRLHDCVILPCVGAALSPGGSLFAVCTSGDASLVQQYYRQRHLGSSVEVWVAKNPMIGTIQETSQQYFSRMPRPLSLAEFVFIDDEFIEEAAFEKLTLAEKNAVFLELKQDIPDTQFDAFLSQSVKPANCFCGALTFLAKDVRNFVCTEGHEIAACIDSLSPIEPIAQSYEVCDFCERASQKRVTPGVCSFCLHRTTLLKSPPTPQT